jgi:hypothetical protein
MNSVKPSPKDRLNHFLEDSYKPVIKEPDSPGSWYPSYGNTIPSIALNHVHKSNLAEAELGQYPVCSCQTMRNTLLVPQCQKQANVTYQFFKNPAMVHDTTTTQAKLSSSEGLSQAHHQKGKGSNHSASLQAVDSVKLITKRQVGPLVSSSTHMIPPATTSTKYMVT